MAIHKSTGNVFEDLGFDRTTANSLRMRSFLMGQLTNWIREHEYTQKEAADALAVTQSRISDLMTGKVQKFTVDNLINLFGNTGGNLEVIEANKKASFVFTRVTSPSERVAVNVRRKKAKTPIRVK